MSITIMLEYEFMRTAFAAAAVVALLAGPVGYFLVLRGQTFAGHALAHVGFTGATGAVLLGLAPLYGLFLLTVLAGLAMGAFGEKLANRDVAIGLVLALALGIGLVFLHFFTGFATQATALLFGNILAVSRQTLFMLLVVSIACILVLAAISRPLLFVSLQPELAEAKGVHARTISTVFLVIVAVATAGAAQIVGVLLVFALMVGPAAAAQRLTLGVVAGLVISAALALAEAWGGLALAYVTDWPTSFWITALSVGVYVVSLTLPKAVHR
ncbi:MAG: metal ABC transporter permease [Aestuariivirga sp.]